MAYDMMLNFGNEAGIGGFEAQTREIKRRTAMLARARSKPGSKAPTAAEVRMPPSGKSVTLVTECCHGQSFLAVRRVLGELPNRNGAGA